MNRNFSRGQEEAPVELLIGVTVLTFVLIVGYGTYQNLTSSQYEQKLSASLSKMARAIEVVYRGSTGTRLTEQVDFSPIGSETGTIEAIALYPGAKSTCKRQIGTDDCLLLIARVKIRNENGGEDTNARVIETINIPSTIAIKRETNDETIQCFLDTPPGDDSLADPKEETLSNGEIKERCSWKPQVYGLVIEKTSAREITIRGS